MAEILMEIQLGPQKKQKDRKTQTDFEVPELPRGFITRGYGKEHGDNTSVEVGGNLASQRSFWVNAGDVVNVLYIDDAVWWKVSLTSSNDATDDAGNPERTKVGWVPAPHIQLLTHRASKATDLSPGRRAWRGVSCNTTGTRCNTREAGKTLATSKKYGSDDIEEDREVAKLMTYKRITDFRAFSKGQETKKMPGEWLVDHVAAHVLYFYMLAIHCWLAVASRPTVFQSLIGTSLGFVAVDLLSTVYHLFLDYGLLATASTTVTDLHHTLPLNYNLFTQRQLLATSYVAIVPMHLVHLLIYCLIVILASSGKTHAAVAASNAFPSTASPLYLVYMASSLAIGSTCGFVHNAAHRRRHKLPIFSGVRVLQDAGLLLHPAVHALHHEGAHDMNYSLFSGITHPATNFILRALRHYGILPLTDEHFRYQRDLAESS